MRDTDSAIDFADQLTPRVCAYCSNPIKRDHRRGHGWSHIGAAGRPPSSSCVDPGGRIRSPEPCVSPYPRPPTVAVAHIMWLDPTKALPTRDVYVCGLYQHSGKWNPRSVYYMNALDGWADELGDHTEAPYFWWPLPAEDTEQSG